MFWRKKRAQVVGEAVNTATELAEKTLTIGAGGVLLLLGAALAGAAATYLITSKRQQATSSEPEKEQK